MCAIPRPPRTVSWRGPMSTKKAAATATAHVRHRRPAREDPQRRARRPFRRGQDHAGRGAARRDRRDRPRRDGRRRLDGQRPRPGRGRPAALGRAVGVPAALGRRRREPARHPRLPRLHRRAARRAARGRRRPVRRVGGRRDRPDHRVALWEECAALGTPRAVVITKLDAPRANYDDASRPASGCSAAPTARPCCRCTCPSARPETAQALSGC